MSILARYYVPSILDDNYVFSPSGIYKAPQEGKLENYRTYIEQLPTVDDPEVFGMHENANITFQTKESVDMLTVILSIQPRIVSGTGGKSDDEIVRALARDLRDNLPNILDTEEAGEKTFVYRDGVMDSLGTVLIQEMERFNNLLRTLKDTLTNLCRAIVGEVVMSLELDKIFGSLLNNQVPTSWSAVAYPSLKPLSSWIEDLHKRIDFMRTWLKKGKPKAFWMSGFFFPQGFMTGTLQNYSKKKKYRLRGRSSETAKAHRG
eukprot:TRINITY_DN315_c0_g4_i1.p1 TRINITY_DN315_c0_g4~~TRINITY_DN315_c0_g4_i1.p1  ORF type:complete len:262 (-),score=54.56 TRINITY_DN315_c0_g4_i1:2-787(-)